MFVINKMFKPCNSRWFQGSIAVLALVCCSGLAAERQSTLSCLSFEDALHVNARLDPAIGEAQTEQARAEARLKQIKSSWYPQLRGYGRTASGQTGLVDGRTDNQIGVVLSQRLYDFGQGRFEKRAAVSRVQASEFGVNEVLTDSSLVVAITYLNILEAVESLDAAKLRQDDVASVAAGVTRRLETNLITAAEARSIEADHANAIANRIEVELQLAEAKSKLAILTASSGELCDYLPPIKTQLQKNMPDSLVESLEHAHAGSRMQAADAGSKAAESELRVANGARLPVIEVQAVVAEIYDKDLNNWESSNRLGLDISSPLLGGSYSGQRDEAAANLRATKLGIDRLRREITESTTLTWERISAFEQLAVSRMNARDSLRLETEALRKEFEKGLRTYQEIKTVEADLQLAVIQEIEARFLAHKQRVNLLALTNLLLTY